MNIYLSTYGISLIVVEHMNSLSDLVIRNLFKIQRSYRYWHASKPAPISFNSSFQMNFSAGAEYILYHLSYYYRITVMNIKHPSKSLVRLLLLCLLLLLLLLLLARCPEWFTYT